LGPKLLKHKSSKKTENRKSSHLEICLKEDVAAKKVSTGFEDVFLIHKALPEIDLNDVNLTNSFFKHDFSAPIIVEAMTGGTEKALRINAAIALAVEELGLGMGVGSQRAALDDPRLERTYSIVRKKAPNAFLLANIGAPQLKKEYKLKKIKKAIEMIDADALVIHLNPLQESVQPEGETKFRGIIQNIKKITDVLEKPVIIKETGAGIAAEEAIKIKEAGVSAIDVAGAGGTSWAAVEYFRAKQIKSFHGQKLGKTLWDWGIPTVVSLVEVVQSVDLPIIVSGGIRSGLDIAKGIALGADLAGLAWPILGSASKSSVDVKRKICFMIDVLKTVMFLVGVKTIKKLKGSPLVITGRTAEWLQTRGFDLKKYALRGEEF
jgi:isopentenyl-diphosphate delta-isomerase